MEARSAKIAASRRPRFQFEDVSLLIETAASLTIASLSVRFLPFRHIVAAIARHRIDGHCRAVDLGQLRWAIRGVARRLPLRTKCIETGICLQRMLARRGVAATLHYGVGRNEAGEIAAHVWVSVKGEVVHGGEAAPGYHCVSTFSPRGKE